MQLPLANHPRFQHSDTQAMSDLYLMKLDEEEKEAEAFRNTINNPIRTVSAYDAFMK